MGMPRFLSRQQSNNHLGPLMSNGKMSASGSGIGTPANRYGFDRQVPTPSESVATTAQQMGAMSESGVGGPQEETWQTLFK